MSSLPALLMTRHSVGHASLRWAFRGQAHTPPCGGGPGGTRSCPQWSTSTPTSSWCLLALMHTGRTSSTTGSQAMGHVASVACTQSPNTEQYIPGLRPCLHALVQALVNLEIELAVFSSLLHAGVLLRQHHALRLHCRYIGVTEADYEWLTDQIVQVANR